MDIAPIAHNEFMLYPNPTSEHLTIDNVNEGAIIRVFDAYGNLVVAENAVSGKSEIDLSGFANGIYLVVVEQDGTQTAQRLILNK